MKVTKPDTNTTSKGKRHEGSVVVFFLPLPDKMYLPTKLDTTRGGNVPFLSASTPLSPSVFSQNRSPPWVASKMSQIPAVAVVPTGGNGCPKTAADSYDHVAPAAAECRLLLLLSSGRLGIEPSTLYAPEDDSYGMKEGGR